MGSTKNVEKGSKNVSSWQRGMVEGGWWCSMGLWKKLTINMCCFET